MSNLPVTYRGTVQAWHCDHMGHMNVMHYVGKFDEGTWNLFTLIGLTGRYMREKNCGMAAVQQNVTYRREMMAGDTLFIRTRILEMKEKVIRFLHEMVNAETGEVAAFCELTGVHLDRNSRRAIPFSQEVAAAAKAYILPPAEEV